MRSFNYAYSGLGSTEMHNSSGACLQSAKGRSSFRYAIPSVSNFPRIKDLKTGEFIPPTELLEFNIKMVNLFIEENNLPIDFENNQGNFIFTLNEDRTNNSENVKNYDIYACVIISRYLFSEDCYYRNIFELMFYFITYRNYKVMESYIISLPFGQHSGYYSFVDAGLLDIESYQNIKDKRSLFKVESGLNFHISKMLHRKTLREYLPLNLKKVETMENSYYDALEQSKIYNSLFLKFDLSLLDKAKNSKLSSSYPSIINFIENNNIKYFEDLYVKGGFINVLSAANGIDCLNKLFANTEGGFSSYYVNECVEGFVKPVSASEYLMDNKESILNEITQSHSLYKSTYTKKLIEIFSLKTLNVFDEINNAKLTTTPLKKWK